jgi:hypothetical protein
LNPAHGPSWVLTETVWLTPSPSLTCQAHASVFFLLGSVSSPSTHTQSFVQLILSTWVELFNLQMS